MKIEQELKQMFENSWNGKLWKKVQDWVESDDRKEEVKAAKYAKIEEFIQGLLDEKDAEIKLLKREVYLLKDDAEFLSKDFTMDK